MYYKITAQEYFRKKKLQYDKFSLTLWGHFQKKVDLKLEGIESPNGQIGLLVQIITHESSLFTTDLVMHMYKGLTRSFT